ncbi:hypothetical protein ZWY2020_033995 [Hordeum vulgare]|nr:hypothetical protein ZWY2020_033995 [Hordeum vulgare]
MVSRMCPSRSSGRACDHGEPTPAVTQATRGNRQSVVDAMATLRAPVRSASSHPDLELQPSNSVPAPLLAGPPKSEQASASSSRRRPRHAAYASRRSLPCPLALPHQPNKI